MTTLLDQFRRRLKRLAEGPSPDTTPPSPNKAPRLADLSFELVPPAAADLQPVLDALSVVEASAREVVLPLEMWFLIVDRLAFRDAMELLRGGGWRSRHPLIVAARHRYGCMANRLNMLFQQMFRPYDRDGRIPFEVPPEYEVHPMWSVRYYRTRRPEADKRLTPTEMRTLLATVGRVLPDVTDDGFAKSYGSRDRAFSDGALAMAGPGLSSACDGAQRRNTALQRMLVEFHKRWTTFFLMRRYPRWAPIRLWSHAPPGRGVLRTAPTVRRNGTVEIHEYPLYEVFGFAIHCPSLRLCCLYKLKIYPWAPEFVPPASWGPVDSVGGVLDAVCVANIGCSFTGSDTVAGYAIKGDLRRALHYCVRFVYPLFGHLCGPSLDADYPRVGKNKFF